MARFSRLSRLIRKMIYIGTRAEQLRSSLWAARVVLTAGVLFLISIPQCPAQSITFWHPWDQYGGTVVQLAGEFTRETGIQVRVRKFTSANYNPWTGGSQPDIIGLSFPSRETISRNARQGRLYNMQSEIRAGWYSDLWPMPLEVFSLRGAQAPPGRPGIYGVPLTVNVRAFIYNRRLFRQAGVSPPATWSDFLLMSPRLRRLGVVPLAGGFDGTYPSFPLIYEWSYLGSHYLFETYFARYPYTGSRWERLYNIYPEMRQYGVVTGGSLQMDRITAEKYFLEGGSAMILDGPWFESTRRAYAPGFRDWGVFGPPEDRRASFLPRLPGGVSEGAVINSRSRNRGASIRFLRWLTQPSQQIRLANAMNSIPVSQRASADPTLDANIRAFAPYMRYAALDLRYSENPATLDTLYTGTRNILRGQTNPSAVLRTTQRNVR